MSPGRAVRLLIAVSAALGCDGAPDRGAATARSHIFLVTADALRADHLSLNGYPRQTSPRIDAFADTAWQFPDAVTPIPKTGPAFTTVLSGMHPRQHGVDANRFAIPDDVPLLPERLAEAGYRTAAFVSNPVLRPSRGYRRGFEHFVLFGEGDGVTLVERAFLAWLEGVDTGRPLFVWLHFIDPHGPYRPPPHHAGRFTDDELARADERRIPLEYRPMAGWPDAYVLGAIPRYQQLDGADRAADYVAAYDAEIRHLDDSFGRVIEALDGRGLLAESVVVFLSDHGESLGEHDYWLEHGWFAFDATLRVPLLLKMPGQTEPRVRAGLASLEDVAPTLLAAAGLPPFAEGTGRDLLAPDADVPPVLVGNASSYPERYHGLRTAQWKYLRRTRPLGQDKAVAPRAADELYDLLGDPGETRNLAADEPARVESLRSELRRRLERRVVRRPRVPAPDARTRERLRALGYAE